MRRAQGNAAKPHSLSESWGSRADGDHSQQLGNDIACIRGKRAGDRTFDESPDDCAGGAKAGAGGRSIE